MQNLLSRRTQSVVKHKVNKWFCQQALVQIRLTFIYDTNAQLNTFLLTTCLGVASYGKPRIRIITCPPRDKNC